MAEVLNAIRERKEVHGVFNARNSWRRYVTGIPSIFHANYHISESIRNTAKRGDCTRAEQECRTMTD